MEDFLVVSVDISAVQEDLNFKEAGKRVPALKGLTKNASTH